MKELTYYIYLFTNPSHTVLYIGVTNDLVRRVFEHKQKLVSGFASKYNCVSLVYFENTKDVYTALEREKQLKKWNRKEKEWLINQSNLEWKDLYDEIIF